METLPTSCNSVFKNGAVILKNDLAVPHNVKGRVIVGFPGGSVVKNPPANAGDRGLIPGLGRSHMRQGS